jgi:hypothetical protein
MFISIFIRIRFLQGLETDRVDKSTLMLMLNAVNLRPKEKYLESLFGILHRIKCENKHLMLLSLYGPGCLKDKDYLKFVTYFRRGRRNFKDTNP